MGKDTKQKKKILLLGGLRYLLPVIKAAHELGYYVITCDYLPDSIAHKYADEYHNVSILDKEAVLNLAKELQINGIMSFAVDPGVTTAYYVAEQLGLPGPPYESVKILQNKALFRAFLTKHNFTVPKAKGYTDINTALADVDFYSWPVIVKPVDSAGSKGVTKVDRIEDLRACIETALASSFSKEFIIEEFITQKGFSSDTDCFSVNNELKFVSFSNQRFDAQAENPYTPSAYSWPSGMSEDNQAELKRELQRLVKLLNLGTSIYNVETREDLNGKAYIMEVSPRGGGNRLSEMLRFATGTDLIKNAVRAAVGDEIVDIEGPHYNGHWAIVILHADKSGRFESIDINGDIQSYVHEIDLWVKPGDSVHGFKGANDAIGTLVLKFDSEVIQTEMLENLKLYIKTIVK